MIKQSGFKILEINNILHTLKCVVSLLILQESSEHNRRLSLKSKCDYSIDHILKNVVLNYNINNKLQISKDDIRKHPPIFYTCRK